MHLNPKFPLFILFMLSAVHPVTAQEVPLHLDGLKAHADSLFSPWNEETPGATVALFKAGEPVFEASYGTADLQWAIPTSGDTVYMLASVSKQFTAWAIATLAVQGRIDLDADVRTVIPEMHAFDPPVTIRHLVHHTSGLRDEFDLLGMAGWRMDDVTLHEHILGLAYAQRTLNFEPGNAYSYSNTGYTLMAEIVHRVSGQTLGEWLQENVFGPLEMKDSHIHESYTEIDARAAQGYEPNGEGGYRKQLLVYENKGSTGMFSTVGDLATWAHALNRKQIGEEGTWELAHTRGMLTSGDTLAYAFGQSLNTLYGHARVSHSGWHRGFRTVLMRFPDDDLTMVVLANTNSLNPSEMAEKLLHHVFAPDADSLRTYAGVYHSDELGSTFDVSLTNGTLTATHARNSPFTMTWSDPDMFSTSAWYFDTIRFVRNHAGSVVGFEGTTDRARKVLFTRIE
ncbi:MAG: serine hydrolase domain-containing protein [Rhodothermales bacterium]